MKTQGTDTATLQQHLQRFYYRSEVIQFHNPHHILRFAVSDDGPLGPLPYSPGFVVPLFLTIRTRLYYFCFGPNHLIRTYLLLSYIAEKLLVEV